MLNISAETYSLLSQDTILATLMGTKVPNLNVFVGRVDTVREQANTIGLPMLVIKTVSETFRTVPRNCKDNRLQIDIWSQNSELQAMQIYERLATILNFQTLDNGGTHIFWQRVDGTTESFETEANLWHFSCDLILWSV